MLDHEKLDVYQISVLFASWAYEKSKALKGVDRHIRDQLLRASLLIPLNIAEGNGKFSLADRRRFFEISNGSSRECGAILDLMGNCKIITKKDVEYGKDLLKRIVSILTKLILHLSRKQ
ncbi:MAG: four helix bundle protein [Deferribacteres bacterium]|nr:four helix bundle protein [Deferribacteres bacterium]